MRQGRVAAVARRNLRGSVKFNLIERSPRPRGTAAAPVKFNVTYVQYLSIIVYLLE